MAMFEMILPDELMNDLQKLHDNSTSIIGDMTQAGAKVAYRNVKINMPESFRTSRIKNHLIMTKVYRTPSDGGINTKVGFYGYFHNRKGQRVPAPLVANMFEYGSSKRKFPKKPFFRQSFEPGGIEAAMLKAQRESSGGLLDG